MRTRPRKSHFATLLSLTAATLLSAANAQAQDEPTFPYVVQDGDTCPELAARFYGDSDNQNPIHRSNPSLGALPHNLKEGQVLTLPIIDQTPQGWISAMAGSVSARSPIKDSWEQARKGMDLFRAWRVSAGDDSSAEITFKDKSQLLLREHSVAVIYGEGKDKDRQLQQVELKSGALKTGLAGLAGGPDARLMGPEDDDALCALDDARCAPGAQAPSVLILTPSGILSVGASQALVGLGRNNETRVANHGTATIEVQGRGSHIKRNDTPLTLGPNMGVMVERGGRPGAPVPLPDAPLWDASAIARRVPIIGDTGSASFVWKASQRAAAYRVEIQRDKGMLAAPPQVVSRDTLNLTIHDLRPGSYHAVVSAIDANGFEGRPSAAFDFEVLALALLPPGAKERKDALPAGQRAWVGQHLLAPVDHTCALGDGQPAERHTLTTAGTFAVRCTNAANEPLPETTLEVADPTATLLDEQGRPVATMTRGQGVEVTIRVAADYPYPFVLLTPAGVAATGLAPQGDGTWTARVTPGVDAPDTGALTLGVASGAPLASFDVTIDDPITVPRTTRSPFGLGLHLGGAVLTNQNDVSALDDPFAGRVGLLGTWRMNRFIALELDLTAAFNGRDASTAPLTSFSPRAQFLFLMSRGTWRPFATIGAGTELYFGDELRTPLMRHAALGLIYHRPEGVDLRVELIQTLGSLDEQIVPQTELRLGLDFDL